MIIIKIGGGKNINHEAIIKDCKNLPEPYLIVHGANYARNELLQNLGIKLKTVKSVSGYTSVLTGNTEMDVFMMAYAGLRNKRLVELAQKNGINAVGLTGLDGQLITGKRKQALKVIENNKKKIIRDDLSGKPAEINVSFLKLLLENNYIPFICPPILSFNGEALNSENDNIVSLLAKKMSATMIISLFEAPGLLENPEDENSLIKKLQKKDLEAAENNTDGRMKRKMLAIRNILDEGVKKIIFADGRVNTPISCALSEKGTIISL